MGKVNEEIEEMLSALGDPTPEALKDELNPDEEEETPPEEKEEEIPPEEDKKEDETDEQRKEREAAEQAEAGAKEKEALAQLENERKERERVAEESRKAEEEKNKKVEEPLKLDEHDFIGDLDLDDLTRDKDMFNKLLNAVYAKGVSDSKRLTSEGVLMTIPDIVKHNIALVTTLEKARDKFYEDNKDLSPFKAVVAAVFEEVAAKNSDKKIGEIMDLVAPEVRTRLQLKKEAVKPEEKKKDDNATPRLHGAKSGNQRGQQREKPDTKGISSEIEAMNKALGL